MDLGTYHLYKARPGKEDPGNLQLIKHVMSWPVNCWACMYSIKVVLIFNIFVHSHPLKESIFHENTLC